MEQLDVLTIEPGEPLRLPLDAMPADGYASKAHYRFEGDDAVNEVLIVRRGERLFALDSLCPHSQGRMAEGPLIDGVNVHCPLHLYKFSPEDGHAVDMECDPATTFPLHEEDGVVRIEVGRA